MTLLSKINSNPKIQKSNKLGKYLTVNLSLASANSSGHNVCPHSSPACRKECLTYAGRGQQKSVQESRVRKTREFFADRPDFLSRLEKELGLFEKNARSKGLVPCVRLNTFSDIMWERHGVVEKFPNIQFYDYTAIPIRMRPGYPLPKNYHLTFSLKEDNLTKAVEVLQSGKNIAAVFAGKFPKTFLGYKVIDGTTHDLRFTDPKNVVVALKPLGKARNSTAGFVQQQIN